MATPEFVLERRGHIGTAPLWLSGVTADGENTEAHFFPVDDLPPMHNRFREQLPLALSGAQEAQFRV